MRGLDLHEAQDGICCRPSGQLLRFEFEKGVLMLRQIIQVILLCFGFASASLGQSGERFDPKGLFDYRRECGIPYAQRGDRSLELDLYLPEGIEGPHPFALVIHGGAWRRGSRGFGDAYILARRLAKAGLAVASIDYREAPKNPFPAQIEDCRDALRFLRLNADVYGLDRERCVAIGSSAGGHLASLLATQDDQAKPQGSDLERQSTKPNAVVAFSTPFDLEPKEDSPKLSRRQRRYLADFFGVSRARLKRPDDSLRRRAKAASPASEVDASDPPLMILHGARDRLVPVAYARQMRDRLDKAGVRHRYIEEPEYGHAVLVYSLLIKRAPRYWRSVLKFMEEQIPAKTIREPEPKKQASSPARDQSFSEGPPR